MPEYDATGTPIQGWPLPDDDGGFLKSVPDYMKALAIAIEKQSNMKFATMSEFTSKVPSPIDGMVFWVTATHEMYVWYSGSARRVWPTYPKFSWGADAPTGTGEYGEIYFEIGS